MLAVLPFLFSAFVVALFLSVCNPLCAVEACIELVVVSDGIYKSVFANLPIALEHPGKLTLVHPLPSYWCAPPLMVVCPLPLWPLQVRAVERLSISSPHSALLP